MKNYNIKKLLNILAIIIIIIATIYSLYTSIGFVSLVKYTNTYINNLFSTLYSFFCRP